MVVALTRAVPASFAECELTHLVRVPIDVDVAVAQHAAYEDTLRRVGCRVERVIAAPALHDSVFIEDTALVFDELAVMMRTGAASRRGEGQAVEEALARYGKRVARIDAPGTMDGGDVMVAGRRVFVGMSSRTNDAGAAQLRTVLAPFGYAIEQVSVEGCLHLKTAVTPASDEVLVINPAFIARAAFGGFECVEVPADEAHAANVLRAGDAVLCPTNAPQTRDTLRARGFDVHEVEASELAKAEGALTCCSLIFTHES